MRAQKEKVTYSLCTRLMSSFKLVKGLVKKDASHLMVLAHYFYIVFIMLLFFENNNTSIKSFCLSVKY
jgi:hypothetical protein